MRSTFAKIVLIACAVMMVPLASYAAKTEMTYEEYELALANAEQREQQAKEQIAEQQAAIDSLKQEIQNIEEQIAAVIQEKYDILGITEQDVIDAENTIADIRQKLELLLGLTSEELAERIEELETQEARIDSLKQEPVSYLWKIRDKIEELENLAQRVRANLPDKPHQYTVKLKPGRRDCLWRIAEYENIYDDPSEWPKIYRANKSLIDSDYESYRRNVTEPKYDRAQDLIFPGQVFDIPR